MTAFKFYSIPACCELRCLGERGRYLLLREPGLIPIGQGNVLRYPSNQGPRLTSSVSLRTLVYSNQLKHLTTTPDKLILEDQAIQVVQDCQNHLFSLGISCYPIPNSSGSAQPVMVEIMQHHLPERSWQSPTTWRIDFSAFECQDPYTINGLPRLPKLYESRQALTIEWTARYRYFPHSTGNDVHLKAKIEARATNETWVGRDPEGFHDWIENSKQPGVITRKTFRQRNEH